MEKGSMSHSIRQKKKKKKKLLHQNFTCSRYIRSEDSSNVKSYSYTVK